MLQIENKYESGHPIIAGNDTGEFYIDVTPDEPGWFILKFGGGGLVGDDTFFFENIHDLTKLAWLVPAQVTAEAWGDCVVGDELDQCRLSHVTTVVPVPAAGWLMIAGIGGLAALRRRKRA